MCRSNEIIPAILLLLGVVYLTGTPDARAQETVQLEDTVDRYLDELGLLRLRARYLEDKIEVLIGPARAEAATELALLFGQLLELDVEPEARRQIELRSLALLRVVPQEEADDLRLTIIKARYFRTERQSQSSLLGESTPEQDEALAREMTQLLPDLRELASRAEREIRRLEMRLRTATGDLDERTLRDQVDALRSRRSQAMYYLGWTQVELARLTRSPRHADQAMKDFGWLLGTPGDREPNLEALSPGLLSYAHVARAALGVARAAALKGDDVAASRWLDAVVSARSTLPIEVQSQLVSQQILILSAARRWADLQLVVERARRSDDASVSMLSPLEARLLAISALNAASEDLRGPVGITRRQVLEGLAQIGLKDLIDHGELRQVLSIVTRFGTLPIGESGFIAQFVRGVRAADRAEQAQADAQEVVGSITSVDSVANRYMEAAALFEQAIEASDSGSFPRERSEAGVFRGRALYAAGQFVLAAEAFDAASNQEGAPSGLREEALWNAMVALERAIERGMQSHEPERDRLSRAFLERFPASERAAELLIRRVQGDLLPRDEAIEILLAVPEESPLRQTARLLASGMLFEQYRSQRGTARAASADRFLRVASVLLGTWQGEGEQQDRARLRLARQMLDAVFSTSPPDVMLADSAMLILETAVAALPQDAPLRGEMLYRRLQMALLIQDVAQADQIFAGLVRFGGEYLSYAEALLFDRALQAWNSDPSDTGAAQDVVRFGQRLVGDRLSTSDSPRRRAVMTSVVLAASWLLEDQPDELLETLAYRWSEQLRDDSMATLEVLRIHANLATASGDFASSLDSWRILLASLEPGSSQWIDARLESLSVLARVDPERARSVLLQLDQLHGQSLTADQRIQRDILARQLNLHAQPPGGGA